MTKIKYKRLYESYPWGLCGSGSFRKYLSRSGSRTKFVNASCSGSRSRLESVSGSQNDYHDYPESVSGSKSKSYSNL